MSQGDQRILPRFYYEANYCYISTREYNKEKKIIYPGFWVMDRTSGEGIAFCRERADAERIVAALNEKEGA